MKTSGIVRKIDREGRIVIPTEIRKILRIRPRDALEILLEEDHIVLKKKSMACVFCGSAGEVIRFRDKLICLKCCDILRKEL